MKRDIAKRILSDKKEKWWTCKEFYFECDNLRDKFTNENDEKNLKFLDQLNNFVMSIERNIKMFNVDKINFNHFWLEYKSNLYI